MKNDIGTLIRKERSKQGFTQEYLADASGVNLRTIQRIECGEVNPRSSTIKLIFDILKIDFESSMADEPISQNTIWLVLMHLSSIIPLAIIPLLMMIWKKDNEPEFLIHGRDVLNFQISMMLYLFSASILVFLIVGIFILLFMGIFISIITIINCFRVASGSDYNYPLTIQFIKPDSKLVS